MNGLWDQFRGRTIDDRYVLGEILYASEDSAVYQTDARTSFPTLVKVRVLESSRDDRQSADWLAASELSHPNLIRVLARGTSNLDGQAAEYIVMERAEETLAGVLAERALSESETREMLAPALAAIRFLHQMGFVHGRLSPSNVMAVGETLKLSPDNLLRVGGLPSRQKPSPYEAPEVPYSSPVPDTDSWSLGALVVNCLTRQVPEVQDGEVALPALEPPFVDIANNTLRVDPKQRWSVERISEALDGRAVSIPLAVVTKASLEPSETSRPRVRMAPPPEALRSVEEPTPSPSWRIPVIGIVAVLLILILWLARKPDRSAAKNTTPVVPATAAPAEGTVPRAVLPNAVTTQAPRPAAPVRPAIRPPVKAHAIDSGSWYVVVATYTGKNDAEKRARAITSRWPKFRASVFDPPVHDPHHLVVIGSNLSEDEAESLRKRARMAGLPQDVYIKKFASQERRP